MGLAHSIHLDLDGAWPAASVLAETRVDCRVWGPRLRYSTTPREIEAFHAHLAGRGAKFTLFGSGDFHHLTTLWLRRLAEPCTLVSFDNHPDWDIRPPRWCCGTWINRALELPLVRRAAIWGCGNFELNWPGCLFVSGRALREGRLEVWPWTERLGASGRKRWHGVHRDGWRVAFAAFARGLAGQGVYVTVDLDCLRSEESVTNWENGLFTADDIAWAIGEISAHASIVGGDVCGAHSAPAYARWSQRIAAGLDHPAESRAAGAEAAARNERALRTIWPALTARHEHHAGADQQHAEP